MSSNIVQSLSDSSACDPTAFRFAAAVVSGVRRLPAALLLSVLLIGSTPALAGRDAGVDEQSQSSEQVVSFWNWLLESWSTSDPAVAAPAGKDDGSEEDPETGGG